MVLIWPHIRDGSPMTYPGACTWCAWSSSNKWEPMNDKLLRSKFKRKALLFTWFLSSNPTFIDIDIYWDSLWSTRRFKERVSGEEMSGLLSVVLNGCIEKEIQRSCQRGLVYFVALQPQSSAVIVFKVSIFNRLRPLLIFLHCHNKFMKS